LLTALLTLSACATTGPVTTATGVWRDQIHRVPEKLAGGGTLTLTMRVCRPLADAPARVVILNHATPAAQADRQQMQPESCTGPAAQWFLTHGYVVALPLRRGHGDTGPWPEDPGSCTAPNYVQAGLAGAADIAAAVDYAITLPYVQPDRAIVAGGGSGGWATLAYGSLPHPKVSALISIGGSSAGQTCRGDLLAYSAAYFATTTRSPVLWISAANDPAIGPQTAKSVAQSYQAAGGALQFEPAPAFDGNGATLLFAPTGPAIWGKLVAQYLSTT
jgi:dienelactone hydrolase